MFLETYQERVGMRHRRRVLCGKPASGELLTREIPGSLDGSQPSPDQWPPASTPLIVGRPAGLWSSTKLMCSLSLSGLEPPGHWPPAIRHHSICGRPAGLARAINVRPPQASALAPVAHEQLFRRLSQFLRSTAIQCASLVCLDIYRDSARG